MIIAVLTAILTSQGGPTTPVGKPAPPVMTFADHPMGTGSPVKDGDRVTIQFLVRKGKIEVADSKKRGLPYTFRVGAKGNEPMLNRVVKGMRQGGTRIATLTGAAYGEKGAPPLIQPTDILTVTIQLLRRSAR